LANSADTLNQGMAHRDSGLSCFTPGFVCKHRHLDGERWPAPPILLIKADLIETLTCPASRKESRLLKLMGGFLPTFPNAPGSSIDREHGMFFTTFACSFCRTPSVSNMTNQRPESIDHRQAFPGAQSTEICPASAFVLLRSVPTIHEKPTSSMNPLAAGQFQVRGL